MNIVLPIVIFSVGMGLFVKRMTLKSWCLLAFVVSLIIIYNYLKH